MLDTKHKDSTIPFKPQTRYVALCVEHKAKIAFAEHYPAGRAIAHVDEWCKRCQAMIKDGKRVVNKADMQTGPKTAANGRPDLRMANVNNAHDKKWRNGTTRNVAQETQRKADESGIYLGTDRERNDAIKAKAKSSRKPSPVTSRIASGNAPETDEEMYALIDAE